MRPEKRRELWIWSGSSCRETSVSFRVARAIYLPRNLTAPRVHREQIRNSPAHLRRPLCAVTHFIGVYLRRRQRDETCKRLLGDAGIPLLTRFGEPREQIGRVPPLGKSRARRALIAFRWLSRGSRPALNGDFIGRSQKALLKTLSLSLSSPSR